MRKGFRERERWPGDPSVIADSCRQTDDAVALFGETAYISEYCAMAKFADMFGKRVQAEVGVAAADPVLAEKFPCLWMLLAYTQDDEGKKRQTGVLTVLAEDGQVKVGIRDRDKLVSLWRGSPTLQGALESIERALAGGEADWRKTDWKSRDRK